MSLQIINNLSLIHSCGSEMTPYKIFFDSSLFSVQFICPKCGEKVMYRFWERGNIPKYSTDDKGKDVVDLRDFEREGDVLFGSSSGGGISIIKGGTVNVIDTEDDRVTKIVDFLKNNGFSVSRARDCTETPGVIDRISEKGISIWYYYFASQTRCVFDVYIRDTYTDKCFNAWYSFDTAVEELHYLKTANIIEEAMGMIK